MNNKKIASAICIVLVVVLLGSLLLSAFGSAFAVTQSEIDALKNQQSAIVAEKEQLQGKMGDLQGQLEAVAAKKLALDEQNELARQEIVIIDEQIAVYDKLIAKKAQELEEAKIVEEEQKQALRVRMRAMEENGSLSYFEILFGATSFTDFLSKLSDISVIMEHDKKLETAYIEARQHVEEVKAEYEATQAEQEATKVELEAKKAELEAQIEVAYQMVKDLEKDIETFKAEYNAQEALEKALHADIDAKLAEFERQQAQGGGGSFTPGSGNYTWPVPGHAAGSAYGWRMHPIFHEMRFHAGEDIGAPTGTPILAADSGTVVTSVFSSSYGNYVVISHGSGNSTLYAHMSSAAVTSGQAVTKGSVIGYVGSTGWSTGPHLHFEVKIGGVTTDPKSLF